MDDVSRIRYLNTDLDLVAPTPLAPLNSHLESRGVSPLRPTLGEDGIWYVTFETDEIFGEPCPNIAAMLSAIESTLTMSCHYVAQAFDTSFLGLRCAPRQATHIAPLTRQP